MDILIERIYNCVNYCIGHLYVDGSYVCDTLEDCDRMLDESMTLKEIKDRKIKDKTAIPTGHYNILMNVVSPKYSQREYYMKVCKGKVPRLEYVKGYSGVLIHVGNSAVDTSGCLLVGLNKVKGKVINSKMCFENLYNKMNVAYRIGEKISLTIRRCYKR